MGRQVTEGRPNLKKRKKRTSRNYVCPPQAMHLKFKDPQDVVSNKEPLKTLQNACKSLLIKMNS